MDLMTACFLAFGIAIEIGIHPDPDGDFDPDWNPQYWGMSPTAGHNTFTTRCAADRSGQRSLPHEAMAGAAASAGAPGIFPLVPVGMGIFALAAGIMGLVKANTSQSRQGDYDQRRAAMVARLEAMRRG